MRNLYMFAMALGCLLAAPKVSAIEPLTAIQLQEVCGDVETSLDTPEARLCIFYVKGFLDGAVATDARVAENVVAEMEKEERFTERAIRTRVGSRIRDFGPSVYAGFCVGQPDPISDVVLHVREELGRYDNLENVQAQSVVYASLRRHYPCNAN